jgi:hypothetical protein
MALCNAGHGSCPCRRDTFLSNARPILTADVQGERRFLQTSLLCVEDSTQPDGFFDVASAGRKRARRLDKWKSIAHGGCESCHWFDASYTCLWALIG